MSYNDYFGISDNDYNMFTESSITGRYDYMDITEATQKFQIDIIDMLHEFTENVWITEATNVANGRRPYALFEAEGFWEKVKDMFRKAIAWIKDMYIKVKGWLLDKWEDAKKWWKTMGMSESDVKIGAELYHTRVYNKKSKVVPNDSATDASDLKNNDINKQWGGSKDNKLGGLDVKIKYTDFNTLEKIENLISRIPTKTSDVSQFLIRFVKKYSQFDSNLMDGSGAVYDTRKVGVNVGEMTKLIGKSLDDFFKHEVYNNEDSEKYYIITPDMLSDAITVVFKLRNNFISRIMNHERACTKLLENTLRQAQKYQSGTTEYKNDHDDVLGDYDTEESISAMTGGGGNIKISSKKSKMSVDVLSAQIRFNSEVVKKSIEAYRRLLSNSIGIIKRIMNNERIKKTIKAIKNGDREETAYKNLTESYNDYWDNNDYRGSMESYMWS